MERTPLLSQNQSFRSATELDTSRSSDINKWPGCLGVLGQENGGGEGHVIREAHGVVAADDARCSAVGAAVLREGGHAVDAAVATALCLGVVSPMSSGIGGGAFLVVRSSADGEALAYDMRETAPGAASRVLNILASYSTEETANGPLGVHSLIEALKHMFAIRMNLGDPDFVNITDYQYDMLSPEFAAQLRKKILDNTTFARDYYMPKWFQLQDHGTSHFCIVDAERNAVSMTSTVNSSFGAAVLSPSTGILLNNEMDDFSMPVDTGDGGLPPAPSNSIQPNKRPLSSMTPIIVLKDNQLAGVIGCSDGWLIIPAVIQVFLNHFILSMGAEASVQKPRVYPKFMPNTVLYENWSLINGEHFELPDDTKLFLKQRGHELRALASGAVCQLVVHSLQNPVKRKGNRKENPLLKQVFHGMLTAVSDPRKGGTPAGF